MRKLLITTTSLFASLTAIILIIIPPYSVHCDRSDSTQIGYLPESQTIIITRTDFEWDKGITAQAESWNSNNETASQIYRFTDTSKHVTAVGYSLDGSLVSIGNDSYDASGNFDGVLNLWQMQTGKLILSIHGIPSSIGMLLFSPDSKELLAGLWDGTVLLWDAETGMRLHTMRGHSDVVIRAAFSPDGKTIITGSRDTTVIIWERITGSFLHILRGHTEAISCLAFSPDSKTIITGSSDQSAKLWDVHSGNLLFTLHGHSNSIISVTFFTDRDLVIIGSADGSATVWYVKTGKIFGGFYNHKDRVSNVLYLYHNMSILTSSNDDGTVAMYDAQTSALIRWLCPRVLDNRWSIAGLILGLFDVAITLYIVFFRSRSPRQAVSFSL